LVPGAFGGEHLRGHGSAAQGHLLGEGAQLSHLAVDLGFTDEGADAGNPVDGALGDQPLRRLTHRHAADAEQLAQLRVGLDRVARVETCDPAADVPLHCLVPGHRASTHRGPPYV
jgi:hypothetical protein